MNIFAVHYYLQSDFKYLILFDHEHVWVDFMHKRKVLLISMQTWDTQQYVMKKIIYFIKNNNHGLIMAE